MECFGCTVRVDPAEPIETALRRFGKLYAKAGLLADVRRREHYEPPSQRRRRKSFAARKRRQEVPT